ncbi:BTB/POZ domain-containing protein At3g19850 isoform X2 [Dioscorea cayenensis subsp. rotundata]|uniref:BTB/POZ domain-containing protein At3g19850 isoform X2 n=1 Tax=Dioscorea cayennensis subsp. rotundata TaxID=55577 RepID=A0AB40B6E2_DIOCR|nr:BTB/POZ domain-containing protein At3g19850 isoform X2 [Dioscorea cayenensis subsp. rotundata]
MQEVCDLKIDINGEHTFYVNQRVMCSFSGRLRRMVKQEKKRSQNKRVKLKIGEFPGGKHGFELVSRFCYNNGRIGMSPSTISVLHSSAMFLEMSEEVSPCNLLSQAETFLEGLFYWTWDDILTSLKTCEPFFSIADSSGLLERLISSLLAKISANSEPSLLTLATTPTPIPSCSSSSSSPDTTGFRCSISTKTPDTIKPCFTREWWFEDLTILSPNIIEKMMKTLGAFGAHNKNLILTRFLLHYLKTAALNGGQEQYGDLADTAVHGVVLMGRTAFSCRGLFWVLRVVSSLGISKECRHKLERLMGLMLDQATLDDLLVSGQEGGSVYDVSLVLRLVRVFVSAEESGMSFQRMKKVGRLIDKYLGEISPDQSLKVSKFLAIAESLPDSGRDCFDGVYRALDIYFESHPGLSSDDRAKACRCLNYEKLTLEACKDLAKNPRIPPRVAMQALVAQQSKLQCNTPKRAAEKASPKTPPTDEKEQLRFNLEKMQHRVIELEKVCREMKGQMSKMSKNNNINSPSHHSSNRGLPRLC